MNARRRCKKPSSNDCTERPSKRVRIDKRDTLLTNPRRRHLCIASLPAEILYAILSYLSYRDLHALARVSTFFERFSRDPILWRVYEVNNNGADTSAVLDELKRMPLLRKFRIDGRPDSDDILRQLSVTNKNLEELHISNCTGSTSELYLRSLHLIRILERCRRLHTINILGTRFRGLKFYRLLGDMGLRLKFASVSVTGAQFDTFAKHAKHIAEKDRRKISELCLRGTKSWAPLHYFTVDRAGNSYRVLVSYLCNRFVSIDAL